MLEMVKYDEALFLRQIFSDEAIFHFSREVNRHNVLIRGAHHPREAVEHQRYFPIVNVFDAVSQDKVYDPFLFEGNTITGPTYFEILHNWIFTLLKADSNDLIFQQEEAQRHWHLGV